jgi:hypothetical protein
MSRLTVYPTLDEYESRLPQMSERLSGLNADVLKKMARVWVGKDAYKLSKEMAIQTLKRSFRDPAAVRRLAENLTASERDGLMLMKLRERRVDYSEGLALEILLLHTPPISSRDYYSDNDKYFFRLNEMLERGLLMRCDGGKGAVSAYYSSYVCEAVALVADFFDIIEIARPPALALQPAVEVGPTITRRPGELILQLTSFYQAMDRLGSVQLTAKGQYATPSLNKLNKLLGWPNRQDDKEGGEPREFTSLHDAVGFHLALFIAADLLKVNYSAREISFNPRVKIQESLELPLDRQARIWATAYRSLTRWREYSASSFRYYTEEHAGQTKHNALRAALLLALGLLPDAGAWYRIEDLSEALRQRIGRHFTLGYLPSHYGLWSGTQQQQADALNKYEAELAASWRNRERVWIERALGGPLFHLGLVELASASKSESDALTLFRLTEAGRAALHDIFKPGCQSAEARDAKPAPRQELVNNRCWVVQPNFDVVVYLDQATPRQLGFIERIGLRQKADAALVTYRLTRESVYAALEAGVEAPQLLQTLESGSRHPLPPSVARTLGDWAARRERLALLLDASVIEFPNAAARDAALAEGKIKGKGLGDRFILAEQPETSLKRALPLGGAISYEPQPPRSLVVNDDGAALFTQHDLLIASELSAYAQAINPPLHWRITRASVSAARARGWTAEDIINRIRSRSVLPPPAFLQYAIHAWCGSKTTPGPAALTTPPLLQTSTAEEAEAICKNSLLHPHLLARIGACAVLVKPESVKELRKLLGEYGFELGKEVLLPAPPEPEKKK